MLYLFKTTTTMKPHNAKNWWIDKDIVSEKHIVADSVLDALQKYRGAVEREHYIHISDNAIKSRKPMYREFPNRDVQVGYVLTGTTDFEKDDGSFVKQGMDLWVEILTIVDTEFPEEAI